MVIRKPTVFVIYNLIYDTKVKNLNGSRAGTYILSATCNVNVIYCDYLKDSLTQYNY